MNLRMSLLNKNSLLAVCGALSLAACASSGPSVQHYMLPQAQGLPKAVVQETAPVLLLAPIRLSALVDRRGLLWQSNDIQVQEALQHQWAEGLAAQLQRRLRSQLTANLAQWKVASLGSASAPGQRLMVQIDQFHGRYDGHAVVSGHWQLLGDERQELAAHSFLLTEPLLKDGYPELVRSLDRAWQSVAAQIAQALQSQLK